MNKFGFFFMAYQPSWVIQCQSYSFRTVMILFNPQLGVTNRNRLENINNLFFLLSDLAKNCPSEYISTLHSIVVYVIFS